MFPTEEKYWLRFEPLIHAGEPVGWEALLRCEGATVTEALEEVTSDGRIDQLQMRIAQQALERADALGLKGRISVNIEPPSLEALAPELCELCEAHPGRLTVEVTERGSLSGCEEALAALQRAGAALYLDDVDDREDIYADLRLVRWDGMKLSHRFTARLRRGDQDAFVMLGQMNLHRHLDAGALVIEGIEDLNDQDSASGWVPEAWLQGWLYEAVNDSGGRFGL